MTTASGRLRDEATGLLGVKIPLVIAPAVYPKRISGAVVLRKVLAIFCRIDGTETNHRVSNQRFVVRFAARFGSSRLAWQTDPGGDQVRPLDRVGTSVIGS